MPTSGSSRRPSSASSSSRSCARLRSSERPPAKIHDADGPARRLRWPLVVGLAAAASARARCGCDPPSPASGSTAVRSCATPSRSWTRRRTGRRRRRRRRYPGPVAAGNGSLWVGNIGDSTVTEIHGDTRETEFPAAHSVPSISPSRTTLSGSRTPPTSRRNRRPEAERSRVAPRRRRLRRHAAWAAADSREKSTFVASDGRSIGREREQPHGGQARARYGSDPGARRRSR